MAVPEPKNKHHRVVVVLPRKLVVAWAISWCIMFILVLLSFQYTNYVDRRSNAQWCGIVNTFNETYKKEPPSTQIGKILEAEFKTLQNFFRCK